MEVLSELTGALQEAVAGAPEEEVEGIKAHFDNTMAHIKHKQSGDAERKFAGFTAPA